MAHPEISEALLYLYFRVSGAKSAKPQFRVLNVVKEPRAMRRRDDAILATMHNQHCSSNPLYGEAPRRYIGQVIAKRGPDAFECSVIALVKTAGIELLRLFG